MTITGPVSGIEDVAYLKKWSDELCATPHQPHHVRFHDQAAIMTRFQQYNITTAGPYYYQHWLNCQQQLGAANEHCRKLRWWADQMLMPRSKDEWDDWWKEEHYDVQIGQHWNKVCGEEFEEAAGLLKDTKEKREGLFLKVKEMLTAQAAEDPMGKIKQAIASMEELSKTPVADLVEAGTISKADAEAAAAHKIKQLQALQNDASWADIKSGLVSGLVTTCTKLKATAQAIKEMQAFASAEAAKRNEVVYDIPHMRVDYEKPGLYEYKTWFGKFVARKETMGFEEYDE
uniref:Uncharacterized protein n=1 Tax=Eutreptiella gymnastica TaxID=73025 RepID=A0A7S1IHM9_9EUGL|mmetsp:Transcript_19239/g.34039  ORF Transcript_19239/g.34039 Transcript_19239/m.34039 type:complete len:288 (+) Transcript_19239:112-975(+)